MKGITHRTTSFSNSPNKKFSLWTFVASLDLKNVCRGKESMKGSRDTLEFQSAPGCA
jgi:hypothetical protein